MLGHEKGMVLVMEEKKTVFDYCGRVFITFGFSILVLNIFCILVGEAARDVSSLYALGRDGLSIATMMQFFGVSVCITGFRTLFFTDGIIKRMSVTMRTVCMLLCVIGMILICAAGFGWFPVDMWQAWVGFFISFAVCFLGSFVITLRKERTENRRMEEALQKLKERELEVEKCKMP